MCGIAGILSSDKKFSLQDVKRMTDCISHRGPDADGFFEEDAIALGHRRLSIIDLSAVANQPMFSHNERYAMVFNGEIYNFEELKKEFHSKWKTHGDSEI